MPRPFVEHYDQIFADKDYNKDIRDFVALVDRPDLAQLGVLEIGAGTGNQSLRLAELCSEVVAVEPDSDFADVMAAKLKRAELSNIRLSRRPISGLPDCSFDAAAAFFGVLNYMGPDEMPDFFVTLARLLRPGSPFVADIWHAEAALADPPRPEIRDKLAGKDAIRIEIKPITDCNRRTVELDYRFDMTWNGATKSWTEHLDVYLWTKEEIRFLLSRAGFRDVQFWDYRAFPALVCDHSWRLWLRAIRG